MFLDALDSSSEVWKYRHHCAQQRNHVHWPRALCLEDWQEEEALSNSVCTRGMLWFPRSGVDSG